MFSVGRLAWWQELPQGGECGYNVVYTWVLSMVTG